MGDFNWSGLIEAVVILGLIALILYGVYWVFTIHMKTFELLFSNGWLYLLLLVLGSIFSLINIPLYETDESDTVYVNLGGCIILVILSVYLLYKVWFLLNPLMSILAIVMTIIVSRIVSWYRRGEGVLIVSIIVEITSMLIAHFLPFAAGFLNNDPLPLKLAFGYIIGTVGVLIGGDILHLGLIGRDGSWGDDLSIGGAGTKDGVWSIGLSVMFLILISHNFFGW